LKKRWGNISVYKANIYVALKKRVLGDHMGFDDDGREITSLTITDARGLWGEAISCFMR